VRDADVDPAEAELLRQLGYDALIMLPLLANGEVWGLVEVYRDGADRFTAADVATAEEHVRRLTADLEAAL
jgi:GAF domain-containing protein